MIEEQTLKGIIRCVVERRTKKFEVRYRDAEAACEGILSRFYTRIGSMSELEALSDALFEFEGRI